MRRPILLIAAFCLALCALNAAGNTMYVTVKSADLKKSPSFFAGKSGALKYGDSVIVLEESGRWTNVRSSANAAISGWLSTADLTSKRIVSTQDISSASAKELAMAGKGFDSQTESAYKKQGNLNYRDLDSMESVAVSNAQLLDFLKKGRLSQGGKR
ncbi:MAG: SH3 domain-containing protein [Helicobacteraceae bacterium]|nr:SH3 domain-containing protein [Helicobacteraceae bacterium]